ncbi:MAG: hypothetical protein ABIH28_00065 [archaeon]
MSKSKAKETIRVQNGFQNRKHNIPKCMLEVICEFRNLEFIQEIGLGRFLPSTRKMKGKIAGFSDNGRGYLVSVVRGGYEQKFYLRVDSKKEEYEQGIREILTKL